MDSFCTHCVKGIRAERENMENYLNNSLMLVTALSPTVGYENAAKIAKKAFAENISLKEAVMKLKLISEDEFDRLMHYEEMI
jgi:fumarate hydratase class II